MQITGLSLALETAVHSYGEDAGALSEAARHHLTTPGKRTRSQLLFATSPSPKHQALLVHAAAAIELIHEASIVHDDIQDRTSLRRGNPSVWQKFGANTALLLGDHFVSAAFRAIAEVEVEPAAQAQLFILLSQAISRAASGQHLQLSSKTENTDLAAIYNEVAISKTGAFIALPLQFSNLLGHEQIQDPEPARRCGEQLGLAYQILDDLKPFAYPASLARHEDISNRVITAPVAAMNSLSANEDPFNALTQHPKKRDMAINLCKSWQAEAIQSAIGYADELPPHSGKVVKNFIHDRLSSDMPLLGAKNSHEHTQQSLSSYQPRQKFGNTSTEAL